MFKTQASQLLAPTWERLRDHGKPVMPHDVPELAHALDMGAPTTLADVRNIRRSHAGYGPRANPNPDRSARKRFAEAHGYGLQITRLLRPNSTAPARPVPKATAGREQSPLAFDASVLDGESYALRISQRAKSAREQAAYGMDAAVEAWKNYLHVA